MPLALIRYHELKASPQARRAMSGPAVSGDARFEGVTGERDQGLGDGAARNCQRNSGSEARTPLTMQADGLRNLAEYVGQSSERPRRIRMPARQAARPARSCARGSRGSDRPRSGSGDCLRRWHRVARGEQFEFAGNQRDGAERRIEFMGGAGGKGPERGQRSLLGEFDLHPEQDSSR